MVSNPVTLRGSALGALFAIFVLGIGGAVAAPASVSGLVDQNGRVFDEAAMRGAWHLVYFGYTNCPDVCPTSLFEMTAALDLVPEPGRRLVKPVFVTLDPARDSAERMAQYVTPLGHGFITVSGTVEAVDRFAFANKIVAIRNGLAGEDYTVDHTSAVLLFDPSGREVERFPYQMDYRTVAQRISAHVASAPEPSAPPLAR